VSLQGSLDTFALPDVLVLLASTKKSGELHVAGTRSAGAPRANDLQGLLWVEAGQLVGFDVPRASDAAEAVFELLRLEAGSFSFMGGTSASAPMPPLEIEPVLAEAQTRLTEWREIELVVPSLSCWLDLAPEPPAAHVSMRAEQWRLIVAVGGGCNVNSIVDHLGGSELTGCRAVKELVEAGLVQIAQTAPVLAGPFVQPSGPSGPELSVVAPVDESEMFGSDDGAAFGAAFGDDHASLGDDPPTVEWLRPQQGESSSAADAGDEISKAVAAAAAEAVASVVAAATEAHEADASALPAGQTLEDFDSLVTLPPRARKSRAGATDAKEADLIEAEASKSERGFSEKRTLGSFLDEKASRDNADSMSEAQGLTRQLASLSDAPGDAEAVVSEATEAGAVGTAPGQPGADASQVPGAEGADDEPLNRGLLLKFLSSVRN
jgi:hypothetical protein